MVHFRNFIASLIAPDLARKADRLDWIVVNANSDRWWLSEFPDVFDALTRVGDMAGKGGFEDISHFRTRLRNRKCQRLSSPAASREENARLREALETAGRMIADGNTGCATREIYAALAALTKGE